MPQAVWTGSIAFGLVSVPVKLYVAVSPRDVRFHQFERGTNRRIRYERVAEPSFGGGFEPAAPDRERADEPRPDAAAPSVGGREATRDEPPGRDGHTEAPPPPAAGERRREEPSRAVAYADVVKGYEVSPGRFVTLTPEELEELAPRRTGTIDIEEFVDLADIDPVYFEKTYHVAPAEPGAVKPYALLVRAMAEAGKVAVGRFVMRSKEYLTAIRPLGDTLALQTLYHFDELRPVAELPYAGLAAEVSERELAIAAQLISVMDATWDPERYRDTYRERVLELIEAKGQGEVVEIPEEPEPPRVADLMEALRASVEAAKRERTQPKRRRAGGDAG